MLNLIGISIRLAIFSVFVLVLGNWLKWNGKTISDQVKIGMSHAEESGAVDKVKDWAQQLTHDARKGYQNKSRHAVAQEEIPSSERQKLKALIRELNSSHDTD